MTQQKDARKEKSPKPSDRVRKTTEKCIHQKSTLCNDSPPRSILRSSPSSNDVAPRTGFKRRRKRHVSFSSENEIFEIPTRISLLLEERRRAKRRRMLRKRIKIRKPSFVSTRARRRTRKRSRTRSRSRVNRLAKATKKYNRSLRKRRKDSR